MIDWTIMGRSVSHYTVRGFEYVEVPWIVDQRYSMLTAPSGTSNIQVSGFVNNPSINNDYFVASAEQAFIQMMDNKQLVKDKFYQTVSPCLRDDVVDKLHQTQFMKNELFLFTDDEEHANWCLQKMIANARMLFKHFVSADDISLEDIDDPRALVQTDINVNGIEVGSYGIRKIGFMFIVFGTGIALPRFTIAMLEKI